MEKNIKQLRQALSDLKAAGRAKVDEAAKLDAKADRSAEEQAKLDALNKEVEALQGQVEKAAAELEAAERKLERERAFAPLPTPAAGHQAAPYGANVVRDQDPAQTLGFKSLSEFALAARRATPGPGNILHVDERLLGTGQQAAPTNFHQETGSSDGYMVPPQFRDSIWEIVFDETEPDILNLVTPEPTTGDQVQLVADETTPWGSSGVQANWRVEGAQMSPSRLATNSRDVKLHELYAYVLATDELLRDAPRLQDRLTRQAARAIRWKASDAIVYGNGVGKPLGYFESGALISVAKESGQAADSIVVANVLKMFSRALMMGFTNAVWLANSDTIPQLSVMTIGDQPVWLPPSAMFGGPGGTLLGRPVILSEHAKTVGDKGDLQLVNPTGYYAVNKSGGGIDFASSIHLYFDYAIQAFRWMFRFGGQPFLSAPITPPNSSNTKSHFVVLDDRA